MSRPVIGITVHPVTAPDRNVLDLLLAGIVRGVERAGGLPVLIPLELREETLRGLFARLDGVLIPGGGDIDPARYGAALHSSVGGMDAARDEVELTLTRWAVENEKPLFGICRGLQVLNVSLGGTLHQDIGAALGARALQHNYPDQPYDLRPHAIQVEEDTLLARSLGQPLLTVNSLHHQACRDLAPGLRVTARAPDGVIEAVEAMQHPFALAVQWHPECLLDAPEMLRLFEAFVDAAGKPSPSIAG